MVKRVPCPAVEASSRRPPRARMLRSTTSSPTPRPERAVTRVRVDKPGWQRMRSRCSGSRDSAWLARPNSRARAATAGPSIPAPSSATSMKMLPARWEALRRRLPVAALPRARRVSGVSRPWSMALRNRWVRGSTTSSIRRLSSSVCSPPRWNSTCLPSSRARSWIRRGTG
jgi:hypothetical protein